MVRVEPGIKDNEINKKRGVTSSSIEGDAIFIRRAAAAAPTNPRSSEFWKTNIDQTFYTATQVWKNARGCWQDHFYRSKKTFEYGHSMDGKWYKTLTGYQLGLNMLIQTLSLQNGKYYHPDCFCIHPVDPVGEKYHLPSHLRIGQTHPVQYAYDETHDLEKYENYELKKRFPFTSATELKYGFEKCMELKTPFTIPRKESGMWWELDPSAIRDYPSWFPLYLQETDVAFPNKYYLYDCCKWKFGGGGIVGFVDPQTPIKMVSASFNVPSSSVSQCGRGFLKIQMYYYPGTLQLIIMSTDVGPFYDLYFGDKLIGRFGCGDGVEKRLIHYITYEDDENTDKGTMSWSEHTKPCPKGSTKCNTIEYPVKTWPLVATIYGRECEAPGGFGSIKYIFKNPGDVYFNLTGANVEFRLTASNVIYDERGFQNWFPYGACWFSAGNDPNNLSLLTPGWPYWVLNPVERSICFNNEWLDGYVDYFAVTLRSAFAFNCCTRSSIQSLTTMERQAP